MKARSKGQGPVKSGGSVKPTVRFFNGWSIALIVLMAVGTVWLRLTIVRTTYAINQASLRIGNLQQDKEQAELKLASLRSPRRLEILARTRFGLTQPRAEQVVRFK